MNQLSPEQILEAQKASVDALAGLTSKAFEGFEKLLALNLQTMKAALSETNETARKALSVKNPQEWVALQIQLLKPATDKALAYRLQFFEIASATRAEFDKAAEAHYDANKRGVQRLLDSAAGSGPAVAAWQPVIDATHTLYETLQSTAKQAAQVAESSFSTAAEAASRSVKRRAA
ncbi:TIGR01841 family phasin [Cupriavidus sp. CV2]|uniref:TIGR01841 family phasin n=1 Tax=Cupriavidus ulmosensis TaxID=3065913 RepID=UPI00296AC9B6|nr:TIGR01841 family phasin [Cupriavidus sp. CV2]MDW3683783.1 TIGR01841 family phasin [Cupriavidus sp. CV2]